MSKAQYYGLGDTLTVDQLVSELQSLRKKHGNIPVYRCRRDLRQIFTANYYEYYDCITLNAGVVSDTNDRSW